jgi:hypothetical protein
VTPTAGAVDSWAQQWAGETVRVSREAFAGLTFGAEEAGSHSWPVAEPSGYSAARAALQQQQLVRAGAHLAQLLQAIWP